MTSYYNIVKSELICVIGSVNSDMWDRISVPCAVHIRKAERMRSHEFEEKCSKTLRKRENNYSKSFV